MSSSPLSTPASFGPSLSRAEAMSALLAQNWWIVGLRGLLAILFGVLTFVMPVATLQTLVLLFAAFMLVDGVFAIVSAVKAARQHERWGLLVLEGIANILTGAVAVVLPGLTVLVLIYMMAFWSLVSGGLLAVAAFKLQLDHGRWMLVLAGIVSILFGIVLLVAPIAGAVALTLYLGAYAFLFGIMLVAVAFKLRQRHNAV